MTHISDHSRIARETMSTDTCISPVWKCCAHTYIVVFVRSPFSPI